MTQLLDPITLIHRKIEQSLKFIIYSRSHPEVQMVVGEMRGEDVVLMLPPEKPTIKDLHHFQVWCRQYGINFGEFSMDNAHV